jgi:Brp/Blh family beta-carotene 15,15'-monooxygenase
MVLGFFLFFYKIPTIALITFILLSSYHFGEHQWTLFEKPSNKLIKVFYFSYGLTIFSLIFYFNFLEVNEIIFDITSIRLEKVFYQYLLIGSSSLTFLLSILFYRKIQNQLLVQFILLTLYFFTVSITNLVLSFAIYFVLWHSLPSIIEQTKFIYGFSEKKTYQTYFKKAFIYWIMSLFGLFITYYFFKESQSQLLSIFFSFLAAITFPHTFVISKIKKPS